MKFLIWVPIAISLFCFGLKGVHAFQFSGSMDYGEGIVLAMLDLLAKHGTYFFNFHKEPYIHGAYPPVYFLVSLPFYLFFGPSIQIIRAVSLASALGISIVIYKIVSSFVANSTQQRGTPIVFAFLFLANPLIHVWALLGRVDLTTCFFSLAGIFVFQSRRLLGLSLLVLAFYSKQSAIAAPIAVFVSCWFDPNERKRIPKYIGFYLCLVLLVFIAGTAYTHGLFWDHLVRFTATAPMSFEKIVRGYRILIIYYPEFLTLILGALFFRPQFAIWHPRIRLYLIYAFVSVLCLASYGKDGAVYNYFIEPCMALLVAVGIFSVQIRKIPEFGEFAYVFLIFSVGLGFAGTALDSPIRFSSYEKERARFYSEMKKVKGDVLSWDLIPLVYEGRGVLIDLFQFSHLAKSGFWDPGKLLKDCNDHRFPLIEYDWRMDAIPGLKDCIESHYEKMRFSEFPGLTLFQPKTLED